MRKLSAGELCDYLNHLLEVDSDFIGSLLVHRVPCNEKMAHGEEVMCRVTEGGFESSTLGLLNALTDKRICVMVDDSKWVFAVADPVRS